jgi:hypothetical protein
LTDKSFDHLTQKGLHFSDFYALKAIAGRDFRNLSRNPKWEHVIFPQRNSKARKSVSMGERISGIRLFSLKG